MDWTETSARRDENHLRFEVWRAYIRDFMVESKFSDIHSLVQSYTKRDSLYMSIQLINWLYNTGSECFTGHVTWWPLLGLLSWYPLILVRSLQLI